MNDAEIDAIYQKAKKKVRVTCDEAEAHSARRGCLGGDEQAIEICKLVEELLETRNGLRKLVERLDR